MPAWTGLWDNVFGAPYAPIAKSNPPISGMLRVLLQKRGLYGWVKAMNGHAPASYAQIANDEADFTVRGGWNPVTGLDDPAKRVTITNPLGGKRTIITVNTLPAFTPAGDMIPRLDTTLRNGYPADKANNGVTSKALTAQVAT